MDEPTTALARRLVALDGWRWLPGMRIVHPHEGYPLRMVAQDCYAHEGESGPQIQAATGLTASDLPDLDDALTALGLLVLVRERWGSTAHLVRFDTNVNDGEGGTKPACWWALAVGPASRPVVVWTPHERHVAAPTEVGTLVAALEAP